VSWGAVVGVEVLGIQPCSKPSQVKGACPAQASHSRSFPTFCIMSQTGPVVGCCLLPFSTAALPLPLCHHPHFQSLPQPCTTAFPSRADDRIFAVSTLLSSLLIYNLPEAIRESDIAKLSFAVQLVRTSERREGEGVQPCLIHSLEAACRPPSCLPSYWLCTSALSQPARPHQSLLSTKPGARQSRKVQTCPPCLAGTGAV